MKKAKEKNSHICPKKYPSFSASFYSTSFPSTFLKNPHKCQRRTNYFHISCRTCNKYNSYREREKWGKSISMWLFSNTWTKWEWAGIMKFLCNRQLLLIQNAVMERTGPALSIGHFVLYDCLCLLPLSSLKTSSSQHNFPTSTLVSLNLLLRFFTHLLGFF